MLSVESVFDQADSCGDHPLGVDPALIEGVETLVAVGSCSCYPPSEQDEHCGGYCDSESFAVGLLSTGQFISVEESSDSSGHG